MRPFRNLTIRDKLIGIIVMTALIVLSGALSIAFFRFVDHFRSDINENLTMHARLVAEYCVVPLSFDDQAYAATVLSKLETNPLIVGAAVFDSAGRLFASWGAPLPGDSTFRIGNQFRINRSSDFVEVFQPVRFDGITYGSVYVRGTTSFFKQEIRALMISLAAVLVGLIGLSFVLAFYFQKGISNPILEIAGSLRRFTEQSDFSLPLRKSSTDEIGALYTGFNTMVERLRQREEERRKAESERESLIEELESRNRELERFTYTVSHDLKSPLITIQGFLGLLEQDIADGNKSRQALDMNHISRATHKMMELLDDLLALSRIGRVVNPSATIDLNRMVAEVTALFSSAAAERSITIVVHPALPRVFADPVRLAEVFQNLIDNAIKYMGDTPDPRIRIGSYMKENRSIVFVEDNGIGIDPQHHQKVFDLFEQLDPSSAGTGIGLTLVKSIIDYHGGRIWVESEGQGKGSRFCFYL